LGETVRRHENDVFAYYCDQVRDIMIGLALAVFALANLSFAPLAAAAGDPKRGEYIARLGGCLGCHTENKKGAVPFAGGRALKTPFGIFYGPNITPHPQAGIGRWTEDDFIGAMRHGRRPDGANYFPAFPYPSFTKINDNDLRDLWVYLRTLPPSRQVSQPHILRFPFGWRFLVSFWNWLYFTPGPFMNIPAAPEVINRGAYLVQALGHCGECHTPRNFLGGPIGSRTLAGDKSAAVRRVPNLTRSRLERWSDTELKEFFLNGVTPDDETVSEAMNEVIRNSTSQLTPGDLAALIAYLRSLPPRADEPR
jgi:mono/diheme cytochrome c family protein